MTVGPTEGSAATLPRPLAPSPPSRQATDTADRRKVARSRDALIRRSLAVADVTAIAFAITAGAAFPGDFRITAAALAVPIVLLALAKVMGLYDRDEHVLHKTTLDEVPALLSLATVMALLFFLSGDAVFHESLGRGQVLFLWLMLFAGFISLRALARLLTQHFVTPERCLLVGDERTGRYLREKLAVSGAVKAELVTVVEPARPRRSLAAGATMLPPAFDAELATHRIDRVILANEPGRRDDLLFMIRELKASGVKVSVLPDASRVAGSAVEIDELHGVTLLGVRRFEMSRSSQLVKRTLDLVGALAALTVLSPAMLVIAVAIKLDSPGPILFRQRRVGRNGEPFGLLKFRSMVADAERRKEEVHHLNSAANGLFKIPDDPRITRVGRWLRRSQLDELAQLFNVLKGEMSLVGPRPLIPEEDSKIESWYRRRLAVPPGMTGHWQVLGSSARLPLDEMVKLDYLYVSNWSLWGDVRLLLRTASVTLGRRGV